MFLHNFSFCQLNNIEYKFDEDFSIIRMDNIEADISKFLHVDNEINFKVEEKLTYSDEIGFKHITLTQEFNSIPIEYSNLKLHFKNDKLVYINGDIIYKINEITKQINEKQALQFALNSTKNKNYAWLDDVFVQTNKDYIDIESFYPIPKAKLVYLYVPNAKKNKLELAYKFDIYCINPNERNWVYVSAVNGEILFKNSRICNINGIAETKYSGTRTISCKQVGNVYELKEDNSGRCNIETTVNSQSISDNDNVWTSVEYNNSINAQAALDAHWGAEMFYDYFKQKHNRNSIDNAGFTLRAAYSSSPIDNAEWNSGYAILYGGDVLFKPLTSLDVVAHEFGHGLCVNTCNLTYSGESGAIHEGLSDIWGACVEAFATNNKQTWLIGEDIAKTRPSLRSMSNPNAEDNPDTYKGLFWDSTSSSNSKIVHTNSGVINHWFYLLSVGGNGINDLSNNFSVQGIGIYNAAQIIYRAETVYFTNSTDYIQARQLTIQAAKDIFGLCSPEVENVINAWYAVGVGNSLAGGNTLLISNAVQPYTYDYKYAAIHLEAYNKINPNSTALYESSKIVKLSDGFHALNGSNFIARIEECNSSNGGYKISPIVKEENQNSTYKDKVLEYKIYPNPFNEIINIESHNVDDTKEIIIHSDIGQILYEGIIKNGKGKIDLMFLKSGNYVLTIKSKESIVNYKLIKQ